MKKQMVLIAVILLFLLLTMIHGAQSQSQSYPKRGIAGSTIVSPTDPSTPREMNQRKRYIPRHNLSTLETMATLGSDTTKVHISLTYGFIMGGPALSMKKAMEKSGYGQTIEGWEGPANYPVKRKGGVTMNLGLDVDILPAWRAGINFNKIAPMEIEGRTGNWLDYESAIEEAHRTSWEFIMTRIKHPHSKNYYSHSGWAFGAGLSVNTLRVDAHLREDMPGNMIETGTKRSFQKVQPGLVLRLTYDTYLLKNFSLHFRLEPRIMNAIEVEEVEGYRPLKAHRVNFSSLSTSVGLRVHL